jgi:hypothetical protein
MFNPNKYTDETCQYEVMPNVLCSNPLTEAQVNFCKKNSEKLDNKLMCFSHNQRYLKQKQEN